MHHTDAQLHRLGGRVDADLLPIQEDLSLCGLVQPDEEMCIRDRVNPGRLNTGVAQDVRQLGHVPADTVERPGEDVYKRQLLSPGLQSP